MTRPIADGVAAGPFRPVYRMHRYFARRPHALFSHLVEHYTSPGGLVLDPFSGGGVTVVEASLLGRRAIGIDVNPMAAWITAMEMAPFDAESYDLALDSLLDSVTSKLERLYSTTCATCSGRASVDWYEVSARAQCGSCDGRFLIADAHKLGVGAWACVHCQERVRFGYTADTEESLHLVLVSCVSCGTSGKQQPSADDHALFCSLPGMLATAEADGLFVPSHEIPDCNMQRESALHKKGITQYRQLFSPRTLLSWGVVREAIVAMSPSLERDWLWFTFSAALRYANRMVTRNESWRGDKPLEWAKPGYWLPPVHLEVNPADQMRRRAAAIRRGKRDLEVKPLSTLERGEMSEVANRAADYAMHMGSSATTGLASGSVDAVITDPPYGSYVHYADLTNFWAVWLPGDLSAGLGDIADNRAEAVIARKSGFGGAKSADDYRRLLEASFKECCRVLKPGGYMVLTFNNREPRAWVALLAAVVNAGFDLEPGGVVFQTGIPQYAHTSQLRRAGSVHGDFVYSFKKPTRSRRTAAKGRVPTVDEIESVLIGFCAAILMERPQSPPELMKALYLRCQEYFVEMVRGAGDDRLDELLGAVDAIQLFDSHRRGLLEEHFEFDGERWTTRTLELA